MSSSRRRRFAAEALGTAFLLLAIVGSGIVAAADGGGSRALFEHAAVVGVALTALIASLGPVSGAHFNPVVTLVDAAFGGIDRRDVVPYLTSQVAGALAGTGLANVLFSEPAFAIATKRRAGVPFATSEVVATLGLVLVIFALVRAGTPSRIPASVGAYIAGAIYFTSSTSLANPAVTLARSLTDTWTGIAPIDVPAFLIAQLAGGALAYALVRWLFHPTPEIAAAVVVPHDPDGPAT